MPTLQTILLVGPILLFSMVAHEIAHGYVALRQGDRTALEAGRLSWNPVRHIDPFFTLLLPLLMLAGSTAFGKGGFIIGGAKPVPVNPANFRHPRRGDILVSLAGVTANLFVAIACILLVMLTGAIGREVEGVAVTFGILQAMFTYGIWINAVLIAFNLLPIPPLDGSHVVRHLLPRGLAERYVRFAPYGILVLIAMMVFWPAGLGAWMAPAQLLFEASRAMLVEQGFMLSTTAVWFR